MVSGDVVDVVVLHETQAVRWDVGVARRGRGGLAGLPRSRLT